MPDSSPYSPDEMLTSLPAPDPLASSLATVDVAVTYRGVIHNEVLRVTDSVSPTFVHSLLTEAVGRVRSSLNESHLREQIKRKEAEVAAVKKGTDFPNELPADAPPLPAPVSFCTSVVVAYWTDDRGAHSRRVVCRSPLNEDGSCPKAADHVGGKAHPKDRGGIPPVQSLPDVKPGKTFTIADPPRREP